MIVPQSNILEHDVDTEEIRRATLCELCQHEQWSIEIDFIEESKVMGLKTCARCGWNLKRLVKPYALIVPLR